jgi:hypothetical protein
MANIKIEIAKNTFTAENGKTEGIRHKFTDLGIVYSGTETGGEMIIARKTGEQKYDLECKIILEKGEQSEMKIRCKSIGGENRTVNAKVSAF